MMLTLGLNETVDQLAMANIVHWYGHVLRMEDGLVLRRTIYFEVEGQRIKFEIEEDMEEADRGSNVGMGRTVGSRRENALCLCEWILGINLIGTRLR